MTEATTCKHLHLKLISNKNDLHGEYRETKKYNDEYVFLMMRKLETFYFSMLTPFCNQILDSGISDKYIVQQTVADFKLEALFNSVSPRLFDSNRVEYFWLSGYSIEANLKLRDSGSQIEFHELLLPICVEKKATPLDNTISFSNFVTTNIINQQLSKSFLHEVPQLCYAMESIDVHGEPMTTCTVDAEEIILFEVFPVSFNCMCMKPYVVDMAGTFRCFKSLWFY